MIARPGRREALALLAGAGALSLLGCKRGGAADAGEARGFPGKVADLILHTDRPPNLETPLAYFAHDFTPNDAFFVRWHLGNLPPKADPARYRLEVSGHVATPLALSLAELGAMEQRSVVAVNQCSGNSRRLVAPRVTGVQWGNGAVGNAKWTGVPLAAVLARAGMKAGAVSISFLGMDRAPLPTVPDFEKSLEVDLARRDDVLLAHAMNDAPLPVLNGFPLRLVVPGHYSTYWVKALQKVTVHERPFDGYWMTKAYRIPKTEGAREEPKALAKDTAPIGALNVRSLVVRPAAGEALAPDVAYTFEGIAFDGGSGIRAVECSLDEGRTWLAARLGQDHGAFSFRRWTLPVSLSARGPGPRTLLVRATSNAGETQPETPGWNRAGYLRNVIERVPFTVQG